MTTLKQLFADAYAHDGTYIGKTADLDTIDGRDHDRMEAQGASCFYSSETGQTTVWQNGKPVATYENIYSANRVILGQIKVS